MFICYIVKVINLNKIRNKKNYKMLYNNHDDYNIFMPHLFSF